MTDFNSNIGNYVATIKHPNANTNSKANLNVIDGIKIYPLRYAYYLKSQENNGLIFSYPENKKNDFDGTGYYPQLAKDGYNIYPMPLREGWLYVLSKESNGVYEYWCLNGFVLNNFYTKSKKAPRHEIGTKSEYIPSSTNDQIEFFYSPVQLPQKMIFEIFFEEDKIKLKRKFDCKDWSQSDGKSLSDFRRRRLDSSDIWLCYPTGMNGYEEPTINVFKSNLEKIVSQNDNTKTTQRDVFFMVDDPLGIAEQLIFDLNDLHIDHEALIRSLRTGLSPESIKNRMLELSSKTEITDQDLIPEGTDPEQLRQTGMVHLLGMYIYKATFSEKNPDPIKRAARSVDEARIKKVLGVDERQAIRNDIDKKRIILETFLNSSLFQDYCTVFNDAQEGGTDKEREYYCKMLTKIKTLVVNPYKHLAIVPSIKDEYLDVNMSYTDPCKSTLKKVFDNQDKVGALIHKPIDLYDVANDYKEDQEISPNLNSLMILADAVMNSFWRIALESKNIKVLIDIVSKDKNNLAFYVDKAKAENWLAANGKERYMKLDHRGGKGKWRIIANSKKDFEKGILRMDTIFDKPKKIYQTLKCLGQNPIYRGIVCLLYLNTLEDIINSYDRDCVKAICQSTELMASFRFLHLQFKEAGIEALKASEVADKKLLLKGVQRQIQIAMGIGMYAGAAGDFVSAYKSYSNNDYDALMFHSLAGLSGVGGGSLVIFMANSVKAGWVGIGFAVAVIALRKLGEYYSDTELEKFIKRTVFYDDYEGVRLDDSTPFLLIQSLSSDNNRREAASGLKVYTDYSFQLEEFIYTQAMMPFFRAYVSYKYTDNIPGPDKLSQFNVSIESDLAQAGLNLSEIEIKPYYIDDRWLVNNKVTPLVNITAQTSKNSEFVYNTSFNEWVANKKAEDGIFYYGFSETENLRPFLGNETAYLVFLVRFTHTNGQITPTPRPHPSGKGTNDVWLVYRYKIVVEKKAGSNMMLYKEAQTYLDCVRIQTWDEAFNIED